MRLTVVVGIVVVVVTVGVVVLAFVLWELFRVRDMRFGETAAKKVETCGGSVYPRSVILYPLLLRGNCSCRGGSGGQCLGDVKGTRL
jgi:hypothetical protein